MNDLNMNCFAYYLGFFIFLLKWAVVYLEIDQNAIFFSLNERPFNCGYLGTLFFIITVIISRDFLILLIEPAQFSTQMKT